jgi:hypothetical protein
VRPSDEYLRSQEFLELAQTTLRSVNRVIGRIEDGLRDGSLEAFSRESLIHTLGVLQGKRITLRELVKRHGGSLYDWTIHNGITRGLPLV